MAPKKDKRSAIAPVATSDSSTPAAKKAKTPSSALSIADSVPAATPAAMTAAALVAGLPAAVTSRMAELYTVLDKLRAKRKVRAPAADANSQGSEGATEKRRRLPQPTPELNAAFLAVHE
jgi:hypothetical protein